MPPPLTKAAGRYVCGNRWSINRPVGALAYTPRTARHGTRADCQPAPHKATPTGKRRHQTSIDQTGFHTRPPFFGGKPSCAQPACHQQALRCTDGDIHAAGSIVAHPPSPVLPGTCSGHRTGRDSRPPRSTSQQHDLVPDSQHVDPDNAMPVPADWSLRPLCATVRQGSTGDRWW